MPKDIYAPEHETVRNDPRGGISLTAQPMLEMPEDKLHLLPAFLHTWSCVHRLWGLVQPSHIKPYEYEDDAWDLFQLEPVAKSTLQALVEAPRVLSDVIQRKSRGTWILLHGQSGTGA